MNTVSFSKDCECKFGPGESSAATNRLITKTERDESTHSLKFIATFIPQPSCLKCDKPWRREGGVETNIIKTDEEERLEQSIKAALNDVVAERIQSLTGTSA